MERTLDSYDQQQDHPRDNSQNSHPDTSGLDLQAILLALARRPDAQPRKRNKGVKEPDLFSRGSLDKLRAFIFQCQIYFHTCKGKFLMSQTSFGHISTKSSTVPTVSKPA